MNTVFLLAASGVAAFTAAMHVFVGGPKNAQPVLGAPDLPDGPRVSLTFAWHWESVFLAFVAIAYAWAALIAPSQSLVLLTTLHCGLLAVLSGTMALRHGIAPLAFPPAPLFALIALFGTCALLF